MKYIQPLGENMHLVMRETYFLKKVDEIISGKRAVRNIEREIMRP